MKNKIAYSAVPALKIVEINSKVCQATQQQLFLFLKIEFNIKYLYNANAFLIAKNFEKLITSKII